MCRVAGGQLKNTISLRMLSQCLHPNLGSGAAVEGNCGQFGQGIDKRKQDKTRIPCQEMRVEVLQRANLELVTQTYVHRLGGITGSRLQRVVGRQLQVVGLLQGGAQRQHSSVGHRSRPQ